MIYLAEEDFVFKIVNLEEETLSFAPKFTGRKEEFKLFDEQSFPEIHFPYLKKLVKNFYIKNDNNREAILKRDQNMCQLCGFNDTRALEMHHIVSKKSPFMIEEFIHSPLNLITLCANCHSIQHHIMRNETEEVREKNIKRLYEINGANLRGMEDELHISEKEIRNWNKKYPNFNNPK